MNKITEHPILEVPVSEKVNFNFKEKSKAKKDLQLQLLCTRQVSGSQP